MKQWRWITWALIVWTFGVAVWLIFGVASRGCDDEEHDVKQTWCEIGTGVGVSAISVIGFMGFVTLSLIWLMTFCAKLTRRSTSEGELTDAAA